MYGSRRDFLGFTLGALVAPALFPAAAAASAPAGEFRELRRSVGIFTLRGGTIGWLANPSGALVVDAQFPDTAASFLAGMRERGVGAVDALVNSHHHGDHTAGNVVFRDVARRIVAHRNVPELQRRAADASGTAEAQVYAGVTFDEEWALQVGPETVRARYRGPAHTAGDATIHFEAADVVHMGDLVFNRSFPFVDSASGASVRGWIRLLEHVAAEHSASTTFVFGHGAPAHGVVGSRSDVLLQRDLLAAVLELAERARAAGLSRDEATRREQLASFPDHVALSPRLTLGSAVGAAYDELAEAQR
jgi:cyclase